MKPKLKKKKERGKKDRGKNALMLWCHLHVRVDYGERRERRRVGEHPTAPRSRHRAPALPLPRSGSPNTDLVPEPAFALRPERPLRHKPTAPHRHAAPGRGARRCPSKQPSPPVSPGPAAPRLRQDPLRSLRPHPLPRATPPLPAFCKSILTFAARTRLHQALLGSQNAACLFVNKLYGERKLPTPGVLARRLRQ